MLDPVALAEGALKFGLEGFAIRGRAGAGSGGGERVGCFAGMEQNSNDLYDCELVNPLVDKRQTRVHERAERFGRAE